MLMMTDSLLSHSTHTRKVYTHRIGNYGTVPLSENKKNCRMRTKKLHLTLSSLLYGLHTTYTEREQGVVERKKCDLMVKHQIKCFLVK